MTKAWLALQSALSAMATAGQKDLRLEVHFVMGKTAAIPERTPHYHAHRNLRL